jgi:hypothetical protein
MKKNNTGTVLSNLNTDNFKNITYSFAITDEEDNEEEDLEEENVDKIEDEKIRKDLQTAIAKKKAWREKAIDPETGKPYRDLYNEFKNQKQSGAEDNGESDNDDSLKKDVEMLKSENMKRSFQHAHGLSPDATDEVFAYASGMNISPKEALEKPFVKSALKHIQSSDEVANASLRPSGRTSFNVGGKAFKDMTPAERKKAFPSIAKR